VGGTNDGILVAFSLSVPFQRSWSHLIRSSNEKVIAFQVLQFHCFQAGVSGLLDRSLRSLGFTVEVFGCSAPGLGRSFRPLGRSLRPWSGVSGLCSRNLCRAAPWLLLFSPWWGAEFPAPMAGVSALGQSFRPQGTAELPSLGGEELFSPWWGPEFPAPVGRSFRPRPEYPVT
jgi:hypothetical protein